MTAQARERAREPVTRETATEDEWIAHIVATAPPLTAAQIERLRHLLPPVRHAPAPTPAAVHRARGASA